MGLCCIYCEHCVTLLSQDKVLCFFAKTFSSSPLNVTKDIYTSIGNKINLVECFVNCAVSVFLIKWHHSFTAKSLEAHFLYHKLSFPSGSIGIDANRPDIARLLKQVYIGSFLLAHQLCWAGIDFVWLKMNWTWNIYISWSFQMRLMNDFQKEVTTFWIRHPEKWALAF